MCYPDVDIKLQDYRFLLNLRAIYIIVRKKNHRKLGNYTPNSLLKVASEIPFMCQVEKLLLEDGMFNIFEISTFILSYFQSNNKMVDGTWPTCCHCIYR